MATLWGITRDWTASTGPWVVGLIEWHVDDFMFTTIQLGPVRVRVDNVSAPVVASAIGLIVVLIVAIISVRFVFRSSRRSTTG